MFNLNSFYKRTLVIFSILSLFSFSYREQRANAVLGEEVLVVGGIVVTSEMITALVGATLVAGGAVIYANTDSTDLKYIAEGLMQTGEAAKDISVQIDDKGKAFLSWTQSGLQYLANTISDLHTKGNVSTDGSYILPFNSSNGSTVTTPWTSLGSITVVGTLTLKGYVDGVLVKTYTSNFGTGGTYTLSTQQYGTREVDVALFNDGVWFGGFSILGSSTSTFSFTPSVAPDFGSSHLANDYKPTTASDIFGSNTVTGSDGSICYYPKVGVPLSDTGSIDSATGAKVYTPGMSIPYGKTWGDVSPDTGITYPTSTTAPGDTTVPGDTTANPDTTGTIDTGTGVMSIPILGDILKILQKILSTLLSIPTLLQKIIDWFTLDWTKVKTHIDYTDILKEHFRPFYDITDSLSNIQSSTRDSDGKFYMVIPKEMGGDGGSHCVLDLTVGSIYISTAREIIKYGIWIALLWYFLRKFDPKLTIT